MVVLKFGGKSLSSKSKIQNICNYIKQVSRNSKVVVVVSAMADSTDKLINLSKEYGGQANLRELDVLISTGETQSSAILAMYLTNIGVPAISLQGWQIELTTMGKHGSSIITGINKSKIKEKLDIYDVVVVAGFQGLNKLGDIATLGRGGSDTTAVALGAVLNCEVEIYSDFDGICTGDPQYANFKKQESIDYITMQKYSSMGAKVLSSASVDIARQAKVNVFCKQSSSPNKVGTHLSSVPTPFVGMCVKNDLCEISLLCNSNENNISETAKFIIENVKYYKISLKNDKIIILVDKLNKNDIVMQIAKFNNLLENENV